jgi:hypothetical protein
MGRIIESSKNARFETGYFVVAVTRCGMIGADVRPDWGPHVNKRRV